MKMKFTLLAATALMLGFSAQAKRVVISGSQQDTPENLTTLLTNSNSTTVTDTKVPGLAIQGSTSHSNLLVEGETIVDNVYGELGPDEETVGVYADGSKTYIRFRYNTNNKMRTSDPDLAGNNQIPGFPRKRPSFIPLDGYITLVVGPKAADATSDVLTPRIEYVSAKNSDVVDGVGTGTNKEYKEVINFAPITLTNETQVVKVAMTGEPSGAYLTNNYKDPGNNKNLNVNYVDVYVDGVANGQFVSLVNFGLDNYSSTESYDIPKVGFTSVATRNLGFRGQQSVPEGTILIQAEDFDPFPEGEQPRCLGADGATDAYSCGYPAIVSPDHKLYSALGRNDDLSMVRVNSANNMCAPYGIYQKWTSPFSSNNGLDGFVLCGMSHENGDWGINYGGEYLDETSNKISMEQAIDGFGSSWFNYTFEMEEDGYVDISIAAAAHDVAYYTQVVCGGARANGGAYITKYNKPREEGGYVVDGLDDDFLKLYGYSYLLKFDDELQRTNWESFPETHKVNGLITFSKWINPESWARDTRELDEEGNLVNSYFLHITPSYGWQGNGTMWFPAYRSELYNTYYHHTDGEGGAGGIDTWNAENYPNQDTSVGPFKTACDAISPTYYEETYKDRPDFKDIPCKAGKHTISIKSTGGATVFDEIKVTAHKTSASSGVENIATGSEADEANGPAEYFDLQGRKVVNPANGLYIVKRGNKVTKEVIR